MSRPTALVLTLACLAAGVTGTLQGTSWHLNIAGVDLVVARTVPLVETLIGRLAR